MPMADDPLFESEGEDAPIEPMSVQAWLESDVSTIEDRPPESPVYLPPKPAAPGSAGLVLPVRHGGRGFSFDAGDRVGPAFSAIGTALKTLNDPAARHKVVRDLGLSLDESADEPAPTEKKEDKKEEEEDESKTPPTS